MWSVGRAVAVLTELATALRAVVWLSEAEAVETTAAIPWMP